MNRVLESETLTRSAHEVGVVAGLALGFLVVLVIVAVWSGTRLNGGDVVVGAGTKFWSVRIKRMTKEKERGDEIRSRRSPATCTGPARCCRQSRQWWMLSSHFFPPPKP